jgi:hypothetical protein
VLLDEILQLEQIRKRRGKHRRAVGQRHGIVQRVRLRRIALQAPRAVQASVPDRPPAGILAPPFFQRQPPAAAFWGLRARRRALCSRLFLACPSSLLRPPLNPIPTTSSASRQELNIKVYQVAATAQLFAEGATVPFIARYRKEVTGELDEVQVLAIRDRLEQMKAIDERRAAILASLKERNLLTPALEKSINAADTLAALEDIYLPFRPKKRTRATIAKEKGLEPLAELLWAQDAATDALAAAQAYVGKEYTADDGKNVVSKIASVEEALAGARDILAERVSDDKDARAKLRAVYQKDAIISSKVLTGKEAPRGGKSSRTTSSGASRSRRPRATACSPCAAARRNSSS